MKRTIYSLLTVVFLLSCSLKSHDISDHMRMIEYRTVGQFIGNNGELISIKLNIGVVDYNDLRLYITKLIRNLQINHMDSFRIDTVYQYHVLKKGNKSGLEYNSLNTEKEKVFSLDSLLKFNGIDTAGLKNLSIDYGKPVQVITNPKTHELEIEKFAFPVATGGFDSIYRYYDVRLRDFDFSLSKSLDIEKRSKLVKKVFIDAARPKGRHPFDFPKLVSSKGISEVQIKDPNFYIEIFNRYINESKEMDLK